MKRRRTLLLLILIYVGLDLSLSEMPGAFVFDPAESVESIDVARGRLTAKVVVMPTPTRAFLLLPQTRRDFRLRVLSRSEFALPEHPVVNCLPRATCASPRPSEDPH